tara:strand:- start:3914 stop:4483 length:570 start_codon:yes stop_codon:yes gene_type:complete
MKIIGFALLFFGLPVFAQSGGGILTEPYAGYFQGTMELNGVAQEGDIRSYAAGARLGYRSDSGIAFGIDYAQGNGDVEFGSSEFDTTIKDGGVFIGYYFPKYMKVWATYIVQHEIILEEFPSSGSSDYEAEGTGFNVGIGIRGIPFININVIHSMRDLDEANNSDLTGPNTVNTTMLSISLPYNFPWKP